MQETLGTAYDPWEHAERLGVHVVRRPLVHVNGLWVPEASTVVVKPGLRSIFERSVLSHELGHAYHLHWDHGPKHEMQADRFATKHLICPDELLDAAQGADNVWHLGDRLNVTRRLIKRFLVDHRDVLPTWLGVAA